MSEGFPASARLAEPPSPPMWTALFQQDCSQAREPDFDAGVRLPDSVVANLRHTVVVGRLSELGEELGGRELLRPKIYHTRQVFCGAMGAPALQEKAERNSGMFETVPITRYLGG